MQVDQECEEPFASEIEPSASVAAETQVDTIAPAAAAVVDCKGGEDEDTNRILCQSVANANASINDNLIKNVNIHFRNADDDELCS